VHFDGEEHVIEELTEGRWGHSFLADTLHLVVPGPSRSLSLRTTRATGGGAVAACSFKDVQLALFSAGGSISKKYAPIASGAGCTVG
jgi:hypothetical protein